jgi:hypothetical protein
VVDPELLIFSGEFVPNIQSGEYHKKWVRANPGETARWVAFRDAVIAGQQPVPPVMSTYYGRALIAAGKEHMSLVMAQAGKSVPLPIRPPMTITSGGVYTVHCISLSATTPAITISTTEPVTIRDSIVENYVGTGASDQVGGLIQQGVAGVQLTVERTTFNGGANRAVYMSSAKNLTVRNCNINKTSGIRLDGAQASATFVITKNKARNIQGAAYNTCFFQPATIHNATTIEASWNEIINTLGASGVEDNINIYDSTGAIIHDNYIQGAYPDTVADPFSGSGIMLDANTRNCQVYDNQVVDTVNAGIGIHAESGNVVHNNRAIFDGRDDAGNLFVAANVGIFVWNGYADPQWANNDAYDNVSGWIQYNGGSPIRADYWLPDCSGSCINTSFGGTLDHAAELAEWPTWQAKLVTNGITVGV